MYCPHTTYSPICDDAKCYSAGPAAGAVAAGACYGLVAAWSESHIALDAGHISGACNRFSPLLSDDSALSDRCATLLDLRHTAPLSQLLPRACRHTALACHGEDSHWARRGSASGPGLGRPAWPDRGRQAAGRRARQQVRRGQRACRSRVEGGWWQHLLPPPQRPSAAAVAAAPARPPAARHSHPPTLPGSSCLAAAPARE